MSLEFLILSTVVVLQTPNPFSSFPQIPLFLSELSAVTPNRPLFGRTRHGDPYNGTVTLVPGSEVVLGLFRLGENLSVTPLVILLRQGTVETVTLVVRLRDSV